MNNRKRPLLLVCVFKTNAALELPWIWKFKKKPFVPQLYVCHFIKSKSKFIGLSNIIRWLVLFETEEEEINKVEKSAL